MVLRCLAVFVLCGSSAYAQTATEFDPTSAAWNGLKDLVALGAEHGHTLEIPKEVAIAKLGRDDSLLLVHPTTELPVAEITAFLRRGGRLAIVDDYGSGDRLLEAFQITRVDSAADATAIRLRDNPALLVARPSGGHPLTRDVRAVLTNHPTRLNHAELEPVFTLGEGAALVLAGAVGEGRLIAVGDSSLLINNMLAQNGNRQLARNLLDYLGEDHSGRLILAVGATPLSAPLVDRLTAPIDAARALLLRLSNVVLPPALVTLAALLVCAFSFLMAASQIRLSSPYARMSLFARAPTIAGFAGRVAFFRQHHDNLVQPLMAFKIEFESELRQRLGGNSPRLLHELFNELSGRGVRIELVDRMRQLTAELESVATQEERGTDPPVVSAAKFRDIVSAGERILADLARLE